MRLLQQRADESFKGNGEEFLKGGDFPNSCEAFAKRQSMLSDFVTDIAWLLKDPAPETLQSFLTSSLIERLICLLGFLIQHESIVILEKTLRSLKILTNKLTADIGESEKANVMLLKERMDSATDHLNRKRQACCSLVWRSGCSCSKEECPSQDFSQIDVLSVASNEVGSLLPFPSFRNCIRLLSPCSKHVNIKWTS